MRWRIWILRLRRLVRLSVWQLPLFLLLKKIEPAYSMIAGAFVGGVIGGAGLAGTVIICTLLSEKGRKK